MRFVVVILCICVSVCLCVCLLPLYCPCHFLFGWNNGTNAKYCKKKMKVVQKLRQFIVRHGKFSWCFWKKINIIRSLALLQEYWCFYYYQKPQTIVTQTELAGHYVNLTPGCHVIFVTSNNYDHSWIGAPNYNKGGQRCVLYCFSFNSEWYIYNTFTETVFQDWKHATGKGSLLVRTNVLLK